MPRGDERGGCICNAISRKNHRDDPERQPRLFAFLCRCASASAGEPCRQCEVGNRKYWNNHGGESIMHKTGVSYGQLDSVLQSFGFTVRVEKGQRRLYTHAETGALMSLPDLKPTEPANATYVAAVRKVLSDYDIAD